MLKFTKIWGFLLPLLTALAGCSGSPATPGTSQQAANAYILYDVSTSPATVADPSVREAAARRLTDDFKREARLGDTVLLYEAGSRAAERMVAHPPIVTGYNLRVPAALAKLRQEIAAVTDRVQTQGGDGSTNLLLSLETIQPSCTPRSSVAIVSDGIEESDGYSTSKALMADKSVDLPPPPGRYLAGCKVTMLGFGLTVDPSVGHGALLPTKSLAALRQGWLSYLQAAGVRPQDVVFASTL